MPTYAVTVVNGSTGKREEIEVTAPTQSDAELIAAERPNVQVGRVRLVTGAEIAALKRRAAQDEATNASGAPETRTNHLLVSIDRKLSNIFALLLLVLVIIPIACGVLIVVLNGLAQ